jgi:hypothetical protein
MTISAQIDKAIRKILFPVLKDQGFLKVKIRNSWRYNEKCIWVFNLRVSNQHYPPLTTIFIFQGIYYTFLADANFLPKTDKEGRLIPEEWRGHVRNTLLLEKVDQTFFTEMLDYPSDYQRKDAWFIKPDGSNIETAIEDIKSAFLNQGLKWFNDFTNLEYAFNAIDFLAPDYMILDHITEDKIQIYTPRGCVYGGRRIVRNFAKYMNYQDRYEAYVALEEKEKLEYLERAYQFKPVLGTLDLADCFELDPNIINKYPNSWENSRFIFTRTSYPGSGPRWDKYWKMSASDLRIN